jgi:glycosyltransferase involved in cell wall biosynthesis
MRVLLVTDWNRGRGGAEASAIWLRDGLRAAGDEARLLTSSAGTAGDGEADFVAYGTERVAAQVFLQIVNPFAVACARRAVSEFHPHVAWVNMFAHHLSPAVLAALRPTPTVLFVSDYKYVCPVGSKLLPGGELCRVQAGWVCRQNGCVSTPHWLRDRVRYGFIRSAVRHAARVIVCSRSVQRELAASGIEAEVLTMPVPTPGQRFQRSPAPNPVFVFCGRLDSEKGVGVLLEAFARVLATQPSARLRIIGQGPQRAKLESLADALRLRTAVEFTGWLARDEVERQLHDAWALVAPSLWAEPFGLVAPEAVVRAVPVIASASGGFAETVDPGVSGVLVPNNDAFALAEAMSAVACGDLFPDHVLPKAVVQRTSATHGVERYVENLRRIFREVQRSV